MNTTLVKKANAQSLTNELQWLSTVINTQVNLYWNKTAVDTSIYDIQPPDLTEDTSLMPEQLPITRWILMNG